MSKNQDPRVDAYIAKSAAFAQPVLKHLRALVHATCPEAEEAMKWSFPCFQYHGKILCSMAAFKAHMTFGFWHQAMEKIVAQDGAGDRAGEAMGVMGRITRRADLPSDAKLRGYIKQAMELADSGTPARPRPTGAKKPEAKVPPELAAQLKKDKKAATTWENFSPSCRREYVEWITEAKRPETRAQRLATTMGWLAEGKSRHWKYQNC